MTLTIEIVRPSAEILTPLEEIQDYVWRLELYGRNCYKSEDRITNTSAKKFVRMLVRRGHESVIEHCVITARIICSRACSHQLVRHRLASYSQESMRYCNYGKAKSLKVIMPQDLESLVKEGKV